MTTRLDGPLKREVEIDGAAYTLTLDPDSLRLVPKGRRNGMQLRWRDLVSGDAALAAALQGSVAALEPGRAARKAGVASRR